MSFTYHISFNNGSTYTEFYPSNYPRVTYSKYSDEMFLRPVIEEIKIARLLNNYVYDTLYGMFFNNTYFDVNIRYVVRQNGTDIYKFRSSVSNAKIDLEKKTFLISPEPDDACQDVLDKYDHEYDIWTIFSEYVYPYILQDSAFSNVSFTDFSDTARHLIWENDNVGEGFARWDISSIYLGSGDKISITIRNLSYTVTPIQFYATNGSNVAISNAVNITANGRYELTLTAGSLAHIEIKINPASPTATGSCDYEIHAYSPDFESTRSRGIESAINAMLGASFMSTGLTVRSTFLFNDVLPSEAPTAISTYMSSNPTHNYVTQTTNRLTSLSLAFVDDLTTSAADEHKLSFKQFMAMLRKLRAYWYIDTAGYFRIEHQSYFRTMAVQGDLTSNTFAKFKPEVDTRLMIFDKSDIYSILHYSEDNEGGADFIADPVEYNAVKTSVKEIDVQIAKLTTDISWVLSNPGDATGASYLLLETETANSHIIPVWGSSRTSGYFYQNVYLSWYSLIPIYHKYFGQADEATINAGATLTLTHIKEILIQSNIKFYSATLLNWYQPFTLINGTGYPVKIEHDLNSGFYTLDVGFSPTTGVEGYPATADSTLITADSTLITADAI